MRELAQRCKRFVMNWRDACLPARSYAQHGEESALQALLPRRPSAEVTYIDVGANQPTRLSNTYWLYRQGYSGIAVEPDPLLAALWRSIRPRDLFLCAGCGETPGVTSFGVARASVNSSTQLAGSEAVRIIPVPITTVDQVAQLKPGVPVVLLSVDVEGLECGVLRGASMTLPRTAIALIEENGLKAEIDRLLLPHGFSLVDRVGCNLLYKNDSVLASLGCG
jgi:FkbM family methyltransferase